MRQVLLQIATACLLQSATSGIKMCDNFIVKKSATEHGSQRCCNINCIFAVSTIRLKAHFEKLL